AALVWAPSGREVKVEPVPAPEIPPSTPPAPEPNPSAQVTAVKKGPPRPRPGRTGARPAEPLSIHKPSDEMSAWRRLRWIGLAAVPTSFMLGVTTHITTDLSPIPLFWLVALTLYFLFFILVY